MSVKIKSLYISSIRLPIPPLFAVYENPLLEWLKGLLTRTPSRLAKDQLGLQTPINGNVPLLGDSCVNHWAVMLQVTTESLGF